MQRSLISLFLMLCIWFMPYCSEVEAALFSSGNDPLLKIDEQELTSTDFKNWWGNWREKDQPFPPTLDPYVDWLLFVKEAEKMLLFDDPVYRRDINTYLKVLSLVRLKNEEIDSKVNITDDMVKAQYNEFYIPVWNYHVIVIKDKNTAELLYSELVSDKITVEELARFAELKKPVPQGHPSPELNDKISDKKLNKFPELATQLLGVHMNVELRPYKSDKSWVEILQGIDKGGYAKPFAWEEGFVIVQLIDSFMGDQKHFEKQQGGIHSKLRKNEQGRLTYELIETLKKKYGVTVNEERLQAMDPDSPDMQYTDAPLITIDDLVISEKQVMEKVNKDLAMDLRYGFKGNDGRGVLLKVVNGIIGQTLITLEALDRHYEKESPVKELVAFKQKHKLTVKLEQQIRDQVNLISDEDITAYYNEHIEEYTGPDIYKMSLIKGSEADLNKLWLDVVINGSDVMASAEKRLGQRPVMQSYPATHLEDVVLKNVASLNKGDVSKVFPLQEGFAIIYMVSFAPSEIAPLESVRNHVRQKLFQERYSKVKDKYIMDLRENATIEINEKAWIKLKAELIEAK